MRFGARFNEIREFVAHDFREVAVLLRRLERNIADSFRERPPYQELWGIRGEVGNIDARFWDIIILNTRQADQNVTLPVPHVSDAGKRIIIANDGSNDAIVMAPAGTLINAGSSKTYTTLTGYVEIVCDGKNFWGPP